MEDDKLNIFISSKNRRANDTNSSLLINFNHDMDIKDDETLYVNMTSFNIVKSFYACQTGLNDEFQIILKQINTDIVEQILPIDISKGNYNVKSFMEELILQTDPGLINITYNSKLNKYLFKNLVYNAYDIYIKPINAGVFLGFDNMIEYKITQYGTLSSSFVNTSGFTHMIIKINGDIDIQNTVSNLQDSNFIQDKILGIFSLTDIPPMAVIKYDNFDGGVNFKYKVLNNKIPSFNINIVNENGVIFPQMADWFMNIQFSKVKTQQNYNQSISGYLESINYYLMSLYSYLNIPSRISADDLGI